MCRNSKWAARLAGLPILALATLQASPAAAQMELSHVIVDIQANEPTHEDLEVANSGKERMYVVAEPSMIDAPGQLGEQRVPSLDPGQSGLLVTPQRLVLEPGERRIIRISAVAPRGEQERVYRVTVKPVAGPLESESSALKVMVGYDVLVLFRPLAVRGEVTATRAAGKITFHNESNVATELYEGKQCNASGGQCVDLATWRLYPGATWEQPLTYNTPVEMRLTSGNGSRVKKF